MTKKRIDVLMPERSQYGVLHHFSKKLFEALEGRHLICRLVENDQIISTCCADPPDCTIGFNGAPQHSSGIFLSDLIEKPHIACLLDLSYRYFSLLESPYILFACNDHLSCELLYDKGKRHALFFPPAVEKEIDFDEDKPREFEVVLMATFIDFEKRRESWKGLFSPLICKAMDLTIDLFFSTSTLSFVEAFQYVMNAFLKEGRFTHQDQCNFYAVLEQIELYVRGRERVELVKALPNTQIHIFNGSIDKTDWKSYFGREHSHLVFHPPVSYEGSFEVLKKAKFVINSSPHLRNGASERIFNALACGALPVTEENIYLPTVFTQGVDLLFYRHPELNGIEEMLRSCSDEERRRAIVRSGRAKVYSQHTWDCRAEALMDFLELELEKETIVD